MKIKAGDTMHIMANDKEITVRKNKITGKEVNGKQWLKIMFLLQKGTGMGKAKHKNSELLEEGIEPDGMSHGDVCCDHCFNAKKKDAGIEQKQQEAEPGTALNQQPRSLSSRVDDYKPLWDKRGVIQFKNEQIAILKRAIGHR